MGGVGVSGVLVAASVLLRWPGKGGRGGEEVAVLDRGGLALGDAVSGCGILACHGSGNVDGTLCRRGCRLAVGHVAKILLTVLLGVMQSHAYHVCGSTWLISIGARGTTKRGFLVDDWMLNKNKHQRRGRDTARGGGPNRREKLRQLGSKQDEEFLASNHCFY
ncbi:hypothetical protein BD289DRAFT_202448 [Coniella lustricola]|uniref:Uncharacterized protein n=1 Tax=Coniella lustricola TaxID=2025994 RepID=A0A2T2ZSH5_9PEZI|nr:hypothetical protein BD289DRAFT_202448 [Coniella lustricola]